MPEFRAFPKIPRFNRDVIITEKIDGTNACIVIQDGEMHCQSRKRFVTPKDDNFSFAAWAEVNKDALMNGLGDGYHYGEWWGLGVQRGYGLDHRKFSLFNTHANNRKRLDTIPITSLAVVPTLYHGPMTTEAVELCIERLRINGSHAAPGFMKPEGVVVYHQHARISFKVTLDNDHLPKGITE